MNNQSHIAEHKLKDKVKLKEQLEVGQEILWSSRKFLKEKNHLRRRWSYTLEKFNTDDEDDLTWSYI